MGVTAERIGITLPAYPQTGTWKIDKAHTAVGFTVRHLMVSKVRGTFRNFDGAITIGETPAQSSVEVTIDASSIDTGDETRDGHLRSPDFLDVENHPTLQFVSTAVQQTGSSSGIVSGDLTIRGVTRPVDLEVEFLGQATDPWGGRRLGVSVTGEIDREAFGLTWNQALEAGGVLVGRKIKLEIEAQAVLSA